MQHKFTCIFYNALRRANGKRHNKIIGFVLYQSLGLLCSSCYLCHLFGITWVLRYSRFRFPVFPRIKEVWNNQKYLVGACMSKAGKTLQVQVFWFSVTLNIILGLSCPKLQSPVKYINIRLVFLKMFLFLKFQMSRVVENVFLQAWNFIQVLLLPVFFPGPASWGLHFPEGSTVKVYRHTCRCRICKVVWGR